jgi:hypothetical protein
MKQLGHEADHCAEISAKVNAWIFTFTPRYVFIVWRTKVD